MLDEGLALERFGAIKLTLLCPTTTFFEMLSFVMRDFFAVAGVLGVHRALVKKNSPSVSPKKLCFKSDLLGPRRNCAFGQTQAT